MAAGTTEIKTVLVTGASSGFGEACARRDHQQGHRVIVSARSQAKLVTLAAALAAEADDGAERVFQQVLDVRDATAIDDFVASLPPAFAEIDILVNNAGLALGVAPAHKARIDDWETMVDTNIKGLMRITRQLLPGMVERNRGHIVNIGSVAASWPYPGGNVYCASKAFVQQFSRSLLADLLGTQVRVSHIDPGLAETNFSRTRLYGDQQQADALYEGTQPLVADDIAEIVVWTTSVPQHININTLEVMPVCQAWGPFAIDRRAAD